jgi:DNA-binding GntR family transcriptional regulator
MLNYRSLKDIVYDYISEQITSGKLKPNEAINEATICKDLEISRTPVREALMQLSSEGYIEHVPRRGFFTRELSLERVSNIYEILGNLEALAAVKAMGRPELLDLGEMRRLASEMEQAIKAQQYESYHRLQYRFHDVFVRACGNEDLIRIIVNLKKILMSHEYLKRLSVDDDPAVFDTINEEHWHIVNLFEARDKEALRTFLSDEHWNVKYAEFHIFV